MQALTSESEAEAAQEASDAAAAKRAEEEAKRAAAETKQAEAEARKAEAAALVASLDPPTLPQQSSHSRQLPTRAWLATTRRATRCRGERSWQPSSSERCEAVESLSLQTSSFLTLQYWWLPLVWARTSAARLFALHCKH